MQNTNRRCKSCGDWFYPVANREKAEKMERVVQTVRAYAKQVALMKTHCWGCYIELAGVGTPIVTDSSIPAPGTGLTERQRIGSSKAKG